MKKTLTLLSILFFIAIANAQTKSIQPFTGAKIIEDGIKYDKLEIKVKDDLLLTPDIPIGEELKIRITKPWSFVSDASGKVYPGVGFAIKSTKGAVIAYVKNIYGDKNEGVEQNYLNALSLSITLDDKMKAGDSLIILAKFYDTKNDDSLLVTLPCKVVAKGKGQKLNGWGSFSSTYGATGMYAYCTVDGFNMTKSYAKKETTENIDTIKLSIKELGKFVEKNGKVYLKTKFIVYDQSFNIMQTKTLFINEAKGLTKQQLENIKQQFILPAGFNKGIARLLIEDMNSKAKVDAVLSFIYY